MKLILKGGTCLVFDDKNFVFILTPERGGVHLVKDKVEQKYWALGNEPDFIVPREYIVKVEF